MKSNFISTGLSVLFSFLFITSSWATHNRAGEIYYRQTGVNTIEATIKTLTKTSSVSADRDSLEICWGDGRCEWLRRVSGVPLDNDYKRNEYVGTHQYASEGVYTLSMSDPNRNGGILNVSFPFSDNVRFFIQTTFTLSNGDDENNSPIALVDPSDIACLGKQFIHPINAVDMDGDSIAYRLIVPLSAKNTPVPDYKFPNEIQPGNSNQFFFDNETGLLTWDAPQEIGEYNIAFEIITYRDGVENGRMVRDMQILVIEDENDPCKITIPGQQTNQTSLVEAGETIQFIIDIEDENTDQTISVSATSELFDLSESPATFEVNMTGGNAATAIFEWDIKPIHERPLPYTAVFKAADNRGLATYFLIRFLVDETRTSVERIEISREVKIWPNPASNLIYVEGSDQLERAYELFDAAGRRVGEGHLRADRSLDISGLAEGVYFLRLGENDGVSFLKE